jgi:hypothetical protein
MPPIMLKARAAGWWLAGGATGCLAAYQPKGAASLAASYVNLVTPGTYDAAPGTAPTLDASGWVFVDTSTQYLTTGLTATQNWCLLARFSNVGGAAVIYVVAGASSTGAQRFYLMPKNSTNHVYGYNTSNAVAGAQTAGVMAVTADAGYLDGTSETAVGTLSQTTRAIYIGAYNNGSASYPLNGKIQALAIYNSNLSEAQVIAITAAMAAL